MDNVASQNGMPPESHRQIAEDNNIDNPMNVPTGQPLTVRPGGGGTSGGTGR
jgi:hypothetical protein